MRLCSRSTTALQEHTSRQLRSWRVLRWRPTRGELHEHCNVASHTNCSDYVLSDRLPSPTDFTTMPDLLAVRAVANWLQQTVLVQLPVVAQGVVPVFKISGENASA